jgi:hypothetical protein
MVSEADATEAREAAPERRRDRDRPRKGKRPKPPIPTSEAEIDAPDKLTLSMLGVMALVTIVLWLFARAACNYHPPRETRRPRVVKTEELARDPKDAALEMQQRLLQLDYAGALELAKGEAAGAVEKAKADCAARAQACAMDKKRHEKTVESTAALLERTPTSATTRVTSVTPAGKQVSILKLERDAGIWKVVSRMPDDGSFKPAPRAPEQGVTLTVPLGGSAVAPGLGSAPPRASAAPAGSVQGGSGLPMRLITKPATAPAAPAPAPAPSH